jgi:hypothetical protein
MKQRQIKRKSMSQTKAGPIKTTSTQGQSPPDLLGVNLFRQ